MPDAISVRTGRRPARIAWRQLATPYLMLLPAFLVLAAFIGYPVVATFINSFSKLSDLGVRESFGTLENYKRLFADATFGQILWQTILWALAAVFLTTVIGFALALILNVRFPGRGLVRGLVILPWAVPISVSAIIWRWIFHDQLGALNYVLSRIGIIDHYHTWLGEPTSAFLSNLAVEVWSSVPFMTVTLLAGLQSIGLELFEAAKIDGTSQVQLFRYIIWPLMRPVTVLVTLLSVIWSFNSFPVIWILTRGGPANYTDIVVTYLYKLSFRSFDFGQSSALAVVALAILLIFSLAYSRLHREEGA